MTDKKYYWLKLKEDFFEEDTISWIEEQENQYYQMISWQYDEMEV